MSTSRKGFADDVLRLNFSDLKVYGRSQELRTLIDVYHNVSKEDDTTKSNNFVMVQGYSGTGKSTLVREFRKEMRRGNFCSGKFQQLRGTEPFSALASAFSDLCRAIINSKQEELSKKIQTTMTETEIRSLVKVVSTLKELISSSLCESDGEHRIFLENLRKEEGTQGEGKTESFNQLKFAFSAFIRAVSSPSDPLVVFLDDLQWADVGSLDLFKYLVTDSTLRNVLFVGSYRDNEVTSGIHPLALLIRDVKEEKQIIRIKLDNLPEETVNELVSDLVRVDAEASMQLTSVVFQKTLGNIFFVLQFLGLLQQEKLLYYCLSHCQWMWDIERIKSKMQLSDNVVDLVASKITRLNDDVQRVAKVASCLCSSFEAGLLSLIFLKLDRPWSLDAMRSKDVDVLEIVEIAASEGLLEHVRGSRFKFSHDRIQQAAYSLIPKGQVLEMLHLQIGQHLQELMNRNEFADGNPYGSSNEQMIFVVADQLNRGRSQISNPEDLVKLAKLDLVAATNAVQMSAYVPAYDFLKSGVAALDENTKWEDEYELSLNILSTFIEVSHVIGEFEESEKLVKEVLARARCVEDKSRVQISFAQSLAAQQRLEEALDFGIKALDELGQRIPRKPSVLQVIPAFVKAKRLIRRMTDEDFLSLPLMTDRNKITALRIIFSIGRTSWMLQRYNQLSIMIFRSIQLIARYGLTQDSPEAFVGYGMAQSSLGDLQAAYRFGRIAKKLADRLHARKAEAMILPTSGFFLDHWVLPLQDCLPSFLRGHKIGMEVGNIKYAMDGASGYVIFYFAAGLPLGPWESDANAFSQQMRDYNQDDAYYWLMPWLQCGLNLMGRSRDPTVLTGEALDQDEFLMKVATHKNMTAQQNFQLVRSQLGYYFDDMDLAVEMIENLRKNIGSSKGHVLYFLYLVFRGLISIEMYRRTKKRSFKVRGMSSVKALKVLASRGGVNCVHKVLLLEADLAATSGMAKDAVKRKFDKAVATASRVGFLQDAALANERAGLFFLREGNSEDDEFWASTFLSQAHELYVQWGALGKAEQLWRVAGSSVVSSNPASSSTSCKAIARFDDSADAKSKRLSVILK